jgi:hypothetical protein
VPTVPSFSCSSSSTPQQTTGRGDGCCEHRLLVLSTQLSSPAHVTVSIPAYHTAAMVRHGGCHSRSLPAASFGGRTERWKQAPSRGCHQGRGAWPRTRGLLVASCTRSTLGTLGQDHVHRRGEEEQNQPRAGGAGAYP